ncbi:DUF5067 domain-containing protein [Bifidobacterium oedipodis]|uniref:DUF5067 domain-containing protein n=1 Tax=Bifidobacterium oedipodis TaxID=2675322 RepID=A0A7Y0ENM0_9BIFI|nr:DUF5067 domain-containing protein [Bifidobacterium sp. DSM 109957]NMM93550.1 hypothetical protein [Bifidobacterium sp. DSM 109957]
MSSPNTPAQPPAGMPPVSNRSSAAQPPRHTTVAGIVALILGIIALILSFIPIINNLAAVMGVIGAIFAIVAIVTTFRGKKHGKVLSVVAAVLSVLAIVITLAMQSAASKALDDAVKQSKGIDTSQSADAGNTNKDANDSANTEKGEQDMEGDIEGAHVRIISAARSGNDYEGNPTVLVTYEWTNTTDKNNSFATLVNAKAFQNGTKLATAIYTESPEGYDSASYLAETQPDATATVTLGYVLQDDSPVTVDVTALFSVSDESKVSHTFTLQ